MNKSFGASLLIAGTCIGAGMLGLPVSTAQAGFWPSIILLIVSWAIVFLMALNVLEANLWFKPESNFISMVRATLGKPGEAVAWGTYLLLLYSLMAAYLSGGGAIFVQAVHQQFHWMVHDWVGPLPWVVIFGLFIFLGAHMVDWLNRFLMIGLIAGYCLLVAIATPHVHMSQLEFHHPKYLFSALPIFMTAFGFHVIIPGLRAYSQGNGKRMTKIILIGSLIPLVVYLFWEFLVFGVIPTHGNYGLISILHSGQPATHLTSSLELVTRSKIMDISANFFVLFAIASSYLGIAFSLFDFLADGLSIKKTATGRLFIAMLTFLPPLLYVWVYPKGFILALSYAGVFVAILHGLLPASMVWAGRRKGLPATFRTPGGILPLLIVILFSLLVIAAEL